MNDTEYNEVISLTVHTTSLADVFLRHIIKEFGPLSIVITGDCFYGWGEVPDRATCKLHVQINTNIPKQATGITKYLFDRDYEVVTTSSLDEHQNPFSMGTVPVRYSANHQH